MRKAVSARETGYAIRRKPLVVAADAGLWRLQGRDGGGESRGSDVLLALNATVISAKYQRVQQVPSQD